jgi:hypothetical protein
MKKCALFQKNIKRKKLIHTSCDHARPTPTTFHFPEPTFTPIFRRDEQLWSKNENGSRFTPGEKTLMDQGPAPQ